MWNQLLYRDINATYNSSLNISFKYRARMSKDNNATSGAQTGWYDRDPMSQTPNNFISAAAAGNNAPVDSFTVYVGLPATETACRYSDGSTAPVYDKQRRWFSEVLRVNEASVPYSEILGVAGNVPADTGAVTPTFSINIPAVRVNQILDGDGSIG